MALAIQGFAIRGFTIHGFTILTSNFKVNVINGFVNHIQLFNEHITPREFQRNLYYLLKHILLFLLLLFLGREMSPSF